MDGALILLVVLLIVQIWLFMASVELWLAGHREVVLPAALLSLVLFGGCVGLLALARRADRTALQQPSPSPRPSQMQYPSGPSVGEHTG
jgi:hypothetical protein